MVFLVKLGISPQKNYYLKKVKIIVTLSIKNTALHLVTSTCMPLLLSGLEVLSLNKSQLSSLDFVANRFCMKLFKTHAVICKLLNFVMYILILNCAATFTVVATKSS